MRIISNFKDYYDGYADYSDNNTILIRNQPNEVKLEGNELNQYHKGTNFSSLPYLTKQGHYSKEQVYTTLFGFCGKIYNVFHFWYYTDKNLIRERYSVLLYDTALIDYIEENNAVKYFTDDTAKRINKQINTNKESTVLQSYFLKYRTPFFTVNNKGLINLSPNLKELLFSKIIGGGECFQEIERFYTNELATEKQIPTFVGDNKTKILNAGFDLKTSFRNV